MRGLFRLAPPGAAHAMTTDVAAASTDPLWRRLLPVAVGLALIGYVATRVDLQAFTAALRSIDYVGFTALALAFNAALLTADSAATTHVYRLTLGPVRFTELFVIRGASYLPAMLNHHVGQAWLTYFMSRAYRADISRAVGATLVVYATTFGGLFALLVAGLPLNHGRISWLLRTAGAVGVAGIAYAVVLQLRPRSLAQQPLLAPLFEVGLPGHLLAVVYRLPHVLVQFLGAWLPLWFFGVKVPFGDALALLPVILFAVALPVSPQGLGTRESLSIALLSGYAAGTAKERASMIAAASLSWVVIVTLLQLVLSLAFMRRAYRLLGRAA
jgi:hypothetical protein